MKIIAILVICLPFRIFAQDEHSLLWRVSKEGNPHVSYVFGSMHTNDTTANTFSESWWNAFHKCTVVASEVDMNEAQDPNAVLAGALMKDTVLQDLCSPEDYKTILTLLEKKFDASYVPFMQTLKPLYILLSIIETPENGETFESVMDMRLQVLAREQGKRVIGLETASEQAKSIDVLNLNEQAALLLKFAKSEVDSQKEFESLKKFYLDQNLDSLKFSSSDRIFPEKLMTELVDVRNRRFFMRLSSELPDASVFCIVGAMHLSGDTGLIAMLKNAGYSVEPVEFYFGKQ